MMASFMRVFQELLFNQSTVNVLAPSIVYSLLPPCIYHRLLSYICVFLVTAMHVGSLAPCVWK